MEAQGGTVKFKSKRKVAKAELNYTSDRGRMQDRLWKTVPADLNAKAHTVSAQIPADATIWYFNLVDEGGRVVSSEHEYRDPESVK